MFPSGITGSPAAGARQVVNGDKNTVKAQQGVDILAGAGVGHGNGFNGSGNGDNNHNNQQYVIGSGNIVIGTVYTSNNGVRRPVHPAACAPHCVPAPACIPPRLH